MHQRRATIRKLEQGPITKENWIPNTHAARRPTDTTTTSELHRDLAQSPPEVAAQKAPADGVGLAHPDVAAVLVDGLEALRVVADAAVAGVELRELLRDALRQARDVGGRRRRGLGGAEAERVVVLARTLGGIAPRLVGACLGAALLDQLLSPLLQRCEFSLQRRHSWILLLHLLVEHVGRIGNFEECFGSCQHSSPHVLSQSRDG